MDLKQIIRTVDDFPKPGVKFLDVTSILENPEAFRRTVNWLIKIVFSKIQKFWKKYIEVAKKYMRMRRSDLILGDGLM